MLESILTRRSIRSYKSDPVPAEILDQLIRAGMSAPSAWNEQIWHFVVITDRQKLDMIPRFHRYAQMLKSAPAAILVCGDISLEKEKGFWYQDCAAAAENILVAANMLGLGGVWVGIYPIKERIQKISALFKLPKNIVPFCITSLGYPDEGKPVFDRFRPERVHWGKW